MRTPLLFKVFFVIVVLMMIGGAIWNIMVFQDCRAHGKALYQCQAMLQNSRYVAVDDVSNN